MSCKKDERLFILEIIHLYRDLPALWRVKSKEYTDKIQKENSYAILLSKYKEKYPEATKDDVKKKINSLRTNFRKEWRKIEDSRKSGDGFYDVYQPKLWYFNEMQFLIDEELHLQFSSSINAEGDDCSDDGLNEAPLIEATTPEEIFPLIPLKKRNKRDQREELLALTRNCQYGPNDEYEKIASAWAVELRNMSRTQMLYAKKAINDILFEGQMGTLHRQSVVINGPSMKTEVPLHDTNASNTDCDLSNSNNVMPDNNL